MAVNQLAYKDVADVLDVAVSRAKPTKIQAEAYHKYGNKYFHMPIHIPVRKMQKYTEEIMVSHYGNRATTDICIMHTKNLFGVFGMMSTIKDKEKQPLPTLLARTSA